MKISLFVYFLIHAREHCKKSLKFHKSLSRFLQSFENPSSSIEFVELINKEASEFSSLAVKKSAFAGLYDSMKSIQSSSSADIMVWSPVKESKSERHECLKSRWDSHEVVRAIHQANFDSGIPLLRANTSTSRGRRKRGSRATAIYRDLRPAGLSAGTSISELTARLRAIRRSASSMRCTQSLRNCWAQGYGRRGIDSRQRDIPSVRAVHFSRKRRKQGKRKGRLTTGETARKCLPCVNIDFLGV